MTDTKHAVFCSGWIPAYAGMTNVIDSEQN